MKKISTLLVIVSIISFSSVFSSNTTYVSSQINYYATTEEVNSFLNEIIPIAQKEMKNSGLSAALIIAQAANESGWGQNTLPKQYNNYFGVKRGTSDDNCSNIGEIIQGTGNSVWDGKSVCLESSEGGGKYFRVYDSLEEAIKDRTYKFYCNDRYADVKAATSLMDELNALAYSGYRTGQKGVFDNTYYSRLSAILNERDLSKYDDGISYDGSVPSYIDCNAVTGTPYTGVKTPHLPSTKPTIEDLQTKYINTSYTGDITKGYIYMKYHPDANDGLDTMWNNLPEMEDEPKVVHIIKNIFLQGEKLYGDKKLHFDSYISDGTSTIAPISSLINIDGDYSGSPIAGVLKCTSAFGYRTAFKTTNGNMSSSNHQGIDLGGNPTGTPVLSVADGIVTISTYQSSYGNYIEVDHGNGTRTRYAHLSQRNVKVGDTVTAGSIIGQIGSTGNSTGPHLHFEFRVNGTPVNPQDYVASLSSLTCP